MLSREYFDKYQFEADPVLLWEVAVAMRPPSFPQTSRRSSGWSWAAFPWSPSSRRIPGEPGAAACGFVDTNKRCTLRVQWPDAVLGVDVPRANGAAVYDWRVMSSRDVGDRQRFVMDIHSDVARG